MFVPTHGVEVETMANGFVVPLATVVAGGVHLYFTVDVVVVDVLAAWTEPFAEIPGVAKLTVPVVTLHVMAKAVAPAVPDSATAVIPVVTAVAPRGIATAEAINSILRSILLLLLFVNPHECRTSVR